MSAAGPVEEVLFPATHVDLLHALAEGWTPTPTSTESVTRLTPEMKKEFGGRNIVIHQGLMAPDGNEIDRDLRRISLVRTMLIALLAKAVGYGGAINGWELGEAGYPIEPTEWWHIDDEARRAARTTYVAQKGR